MIVFNRHFDNILVKWKSKENNLPLLSGGARQVGKSTVVKQFGKKHYKNVLELNFMKNKEQLKEIFANGLSPLSIIENAQLILNKEFNPDTDLLVFEEVGFSSDALTSLKFFAEEAPHINLIATGSNIGLFQGYPVGKTQKMIMHPMTFSEFLQATGNGMLVKFAKETENQNILEAAHSKLLNELMNYWFVGGMPAAVNTWVVNANKSPLKRIKAVENIQSQLLSDYRNDFGKLSNDHAATTLSTQRVYNSVANQIAEIQDGNTAKFKFKGSLGNTSVSYEDVVAPIDFLECLNLVKRVNILEGVNEKFNLLLQKKEKMFKLIPHDIGLLTRMADISYQTLRNSKDAYKGFIAEIFVLNEFISTIIHPTEQQFYTFKIGSSMEIEFLLRSSEGNNIPVEVKSGKNRKSQSLTNFVNKYKPTLALKFSALKVKNKKERTVQHYPLYTARAHYLKLFP